MWCVQAESDAAKARLSHEQVSQVTRQEMERFQKEKVAHFKELVVDYVKMQIEHSRKVQAVWDGLLPEIEALSQNST